MTELDRLQVKGASLIDAIDLSVAIDGYVPLKIVSNCGYGHGYLRIGDRVETLMEMRVRAETGAIREVTVTAFRDIASWPPLKVSESIPGFPIVAATVEAGSVVNLPIEFHVATRSGEILVFWGPVALCVGYSVGSVCFLVTTGRIAGVWLTDLPDESVRLFESQASLRAEP